MSDEPMVTTDELAAWLKVDRRTVANLVADEKIPVYRVGRKLRFLRAEVAAALRESGQGATGQSPSTS
jgi:excisionase family DNA binding protein